MRQIGISKGVWEEIIVLLCMIGEKDKKLILTIAIQIHADIKQTFIVVNTVVR